MAFRYVNPGLVSLLDSNVTATQYTGTTFSKTGYAFTQTNSNAGVTIPQFKQGDDFWARFDVYIPAMTSTGGVKCFIPRANGYGIEIWVTSNAAVSIWAKCYGNVIYKKWAEQAFDAAKYGININGITTVLMHVAMGDNTTAHIDLTIGGVEFFSGVGNGEIAYSDDYNAVARLYSNSNNIKFSNVIFSNEEISPKEQTIALPISATATDMAAGASGIYIASAANQTLLQTPDVADLIQRYGADSKVTGITLLGKPAYRTGEGLASLVSLSKTGNAAAVEYNNFSVGSASTGRVMDGWGLSGVTINDIQTMQFGWKAAE